MKIKSPLYWIGLILIGSYVYLLYAEKTNSYIHILFFAGFCALALQYMINGDYIEAEEQAHTIYPSPHPHNIQQMLVEAFQDFRKTHGLPPQDIGIYYVSEVPDREKNYGTWYLFTYRHLPKGKEFTRWFAYDHLGKPKISLNLAPIVTV